MPSAAAKVLPDIAPGSFRHTVLLTARRFKSTWVELGKLLVRVRDQSLYEEWGYATLDAYCAKELHIRKQTVEKLVRSFSFLARHEPRALEAEELERRAPAFEVVEVLADAEERGQLTPSEYKSIRDSIWTPERPTQEVKRELLERFPRPVTPIDELATLRRLSGMAERLAGDLALCKAVPKATVERARALAEEVAELTQRG